jgi:hypothetical protein
VTYHLINQKVMGGKYSIEMTMGGKVCAMLYDSLRSVKKGLSTSDGLFDLKRFTGRLKYKRKINLTQILARTKSQGSSKDALLRYIFVWSNLTI